MHTVVIEHVALNELPAAWRARLPMAPNMRVTVRIDEEPESEPASVSTAINLLRILSETMIFSGIRIQSNDDFSLYIHEQYISRHNLYRQVQDILELAIDEVGNLYAGF